MSKNYFIIFLGGGQLSKSRTTLYFTKSKWERAKKVAERMGIKLSVAIEKDWLDPWLEEHDPGNYQTRVTSYSQGKLLDPGAVEGRVRQFFLDKNKEGFNRGVKYLDIVEKVKEEFEGFNINIPSKADNVARWLHFQGIRIWR